MSKTTAKVKVTKTGAAKNKETYPPVYLINSYLRNEIGKLADIHNISAVVLEEFAQFVIENYKKKESTVKSPKVKTLTLPQMSCLV